MKSFQLESGSMKMGNLQFQESIYVAPIEDNMLLGLDFLKKHKAKVDLSRDTIAIGNETLSMNNGEQVKVAQVKVRRKIKIPARSAPKVSCELNMPLYEYVVEPELDSLMVPRSVQRGDKPPIMTFFNCSDRTVKLSKGQVVGLAQGFESVISDENEPEEEELCVKQVRVEVNSTGQLPEHLQDLFERSKQELTTEEQNKLKEVLIDNADAFSSHDLDLGSFDTIEHGIDTGEATPIKHRLRRTPVCFAGEEEKHLEKMIEAGVIEPSLSEWAAPPVLIRKRDGSVRWCVDYRALNKVTKKEVFPLPIVEECLDALSENMWFS
ncbi:hypothetical protein FSP39_004678 [Pinctada imbricata]|uniref:Uncharacterized protein n=1 Tax=Pinctada imbricata TaxID=66713 RepID=A0AA88XHP5_PINIB|nr:hypothetical protein FSP39_004678 [Pinctada imbricata]